MERINPIEHRVGRTNQRVWKLLEKDKEGDLQCWWKDKELGWWRTIKPEERGEKMKHQEIEK